MSKSTKLLVLFSFCLLFSRRFGVCKTLNVGLIASDGDPGLSPFIGWSRVAAGVAVAFERVKNLSLLPEYDELNLTWRNTNCFEPTTAGAMIDYARYNNTHVVLGPPCSAAAEVGATVAGFYNFPIVLWGPQFTSNLLDTKQYPTIMASTFSSVYQARSVIRLLWNYGWTDISTLFYIARSDLMPRCGLLIGDIEDAIATLANYSVVYRRQVRNITSARFRAALKEIKDISRIVLVCLESEEARRNLMLAIRDEGMDTDDYLYIMIENRKVGFKATGAPYVWVKNTTLPSDGRDADALRAARRFIVIDVEPQNKTDQFRKDILDAFKKPPFNCNNCTIIDVFTSNVGELADALLVYAYALNRTLTAGLVPNGKNILANAAGNFSGFTGDVIINKNGTRNPVFVIWALDKNDTPTQMLRITETYVNTTIEIEQLQPEAVLWSTRGGKAPENEPACGYKGDLCPPSFVDQYLGIVLGSVAAFIVLLMIILAAVYYIIRQKRLEEERLNQLWHVHFINLTKPNVSDGAKSSRSLQSSMTTSTKFTIDSKKETENHAFYTYLNEPVVARKHEFASISMGLNKEERTLMRAMRNIDHDNICKFIGLSLDAPQLLSIWKYCSRGSLKDVISKGSMNMDWFFKYSLIRDIAEGIYFLHHSQFGAHGYISSGSCLIDERWQVKLTYFGLDAIKMSEPRKMEGYLWTAPEHIREPNMVPSKAGDIYSFAIVASEIITRKYAWDLENQDYDLEELIYKIKRGGDRSLMRPSLDSDDEQNSSMSLLIRDCWSEDPGSRPNCDQIKTLIKSLNHNRSSNLMDHVFNVLEQYASNLEDEVQIRMKELTEEKKKSDVLLYRMLPKQVADRLKTGQSVEPETFDCVTLFFSDVVSFTTIASRCTPLQVVNLLNDLYTTFDGIIDKHDVYKVETIGDGYLCVSGLPHRNGNEHAREIAEMSKLLIRAIKTIRIAHLPQERINIRVGLHTGSVVTGVVGLTMPRYCLFGDAVNTASRMESNGKPGRIHISVETMKFLTEIIGGYRTELRGEVIVKGKGAVQTHWLLTEDDPGEGGTA